MLIANAENCLKDCQKEKDALEIFKKDLGTFVRFYEFMSQIVDYDDTGLEKLALYARNLFDTKYFNTLGPAAFNTGQYSGGPGDPRTYGVTLRTSL